MIFLLLWLFFAQAVQAAEAPIQCETWVRFSPNTGAETKLIEEIFSAKQRIRVAMYGLTNPQIVDALIAARKRKVDVMVKVDRGQSGGKSQVAQIGRLKKAGVLVLVSKLTRPMHNKFAVIDGRWVVTGSYNWTRNAEERNKENFVVLDCRELAEVFETEWGNLQ